VQPIHGTIVAVHDRGDNAARGGFGTAARELDPLPSRACALGRGCIGVIEGFTRCVNGSVAQI
jgi:hypothetical protein